MDFYKAREEWLLDNYSTEDSVLEDSKGEFIAIGYDHSLSLKKLYLPFHLQRTFTTADIF